MGITRTVASLGVILGINIAVRLFNIPIDGNYLFSNHLIEAAISFTIVSLLIDFRIIGSDIHGKYIKIGLIAFFIGIIFVVASFSSLFIFSEFIKITVMWFKIAPVIIFGISVPSLWIANKLSQKNKILGFENTGKRGLINVFVIATIFSIIMIYFLNKYNILML